MVGGVAVASERDERGFFGLFLLYFRRIMRERFQRVWAYATNQDSLLKRQNRILACALEEKVRCAYILTLIVLL